MRERTTAVTLIVLLAAVAPATAAAGQDSSAYTGSHVSFDSSGDALVDYDVDGATTMESVRVQSQSRADGTIGLGVSTDLSAVANVSGAALSVNASAESETAATVDAESGATLRAHDNGHGTLVVSADDDAQYVEVGLGGNASTEQTTDDRLVVTSDDGTEQAYVVAGEGNVTLNEAGNVTAAVEQGSRLVVRSYGDERTSDDDHREQMIADGTAAASVYLMQEGDERATDTVDYGQSTTVEVSERSANRVNMTVSRTASQGKVVLVSASEAAFDTADNVSVAVDREAAAEATTYAELRTAADGGSNSRYMVTQSSSASGATDVAVAVNHFSSRNVTVSDSSDSTTENATERDGSTDGSTEASGEQSTSGESGPGFGVPAALAALVGVAGVRFRRGN